MGKSLDNFLAGRNKFSFKKKRVPIHKYEIDMPLCPLHDKGQKRSCIGAGCKKHDEREANRGAPACAKRPRAKHAAPLSPSLAPLA